MSKQSPTIALLCGSFNPPHKGHLALCQDAKNQFGFDEVWLVPTPQNPFKNGYEVSYEDRLEMCFILAQDYDWLIASPLEAGSTGKQTPSLIAQLKADNPETTFVWLMGTDSVAELHRWEFDSEDDHSKDYHALLNVCPLVIYPRDDFSGDQIRASTALNHYAKAEVEQGADFNSPNPQWRIAPAFSHPASATTVRNGELEHLTLNVADYWLGLTETAD